MHKNDYYEFLHAMDSDSLTLFIKHKLTGAQIFRLDLP